MNRNSNLNPLPWYESIEEQGFRKSYAYGKVWPLIAHKDYFLPFQIIFPGVPSLVRFFIHQVENGRSFEITAAMNAAEFDIDSATYNIGIFPALYKLDWSILGLDFNNDFDESFGGESHTSEGRYYLRMEYTIDGVTRTMYSEVMTLVLDISCYLKLEWFSYTDLPYNGGQIEYNMSSEMSPYVNYLWIRADVAMPDYTFEEEGEERDGFFFATKQVSEKTYRFAFLATEEVCDALRIVGLSDVVSITDQYGRRYICDKFSMTPEWQQQGYLASVSCEFQTDTVVIRRAVSLGESPIKVIYSGEVSYNRSDGELFVPKEEKMFLATVFPSLASASSSVEWMTVEIVDQCTVEVTVAENATGTTRSGNLVLSSGTVTRVVEVIQAAS